VAVMVVKAMPPMEVFRTVAEFRSWRRHLVIQGRSVGLVPTMGALHAGHISLGTFLLNCVLASFLIGPHLLVEHARRENDAVVISLFVNPAQFAPTEDFYAYPRTWDADRQIIESLNLDTVAVFIPTMDEMYPRGISMDLEAQQGAFVQVLGLSEPVISKGSIFVNDISSKVFHGLTSLEE
jgi:pantoate--beta-alanine ligase